MSQFAHKNREEIWLDHEADGAGTDTGYSLLLGNVTWVYKNNILGRRDKMQKF